MRGSRVACLPLLAVLIAAGAAAVPRVCWAQDRMSYMLLEGSTLTDDCTICGRPTLLVPLRGTFLLVFREQNPLFTTYDMRGIRFEALQAGLSYTVTGEGTYEIGGEVALEQRMALKVQVKDVPDVELESGSGPVQRVWPMIDVDVAQQPVNPLQVFSFHIIAAPVREIWFSTSTDFTSGTGGHRPVSSGDLLSHTGRVVKTNLGLVGKLGAMPIVPDLGLDAVDIATGGEVLFSCEEDVFSETLGPLQHGDLLSYRGRIFRTNQHLTSAFMPMPPAPDVGLDAVQVMDDGEILFSIEQDIFSEKLGVVLRQGDLLSDKGVIVRTNEQLLASFDPIEGQDDVGLDAIHVWPNGEIWFSTEVGFQSKAFGTISDGDILTTGDVFSGSGSVIFRNLELLSPFAPLEKVANFGLDALFLVTEDSLTKPSVSQTTIVMDKSSESVRIEWSGDGKVFQVEGADDPGGPYVPLGDISPETNYLDPAAALFKSKSFYRIRLW